MATEGRNIHYFSTGQGDYGELGGQKVTKAAESYRSMLHCFFFFEQVNLQGSAGLLNISTQSCSPETAKKHCELLRASDKNGGHQN